MRKIKKYANRKLYDTVDKSYISMEQLAELVRSGETVSVLDNQTGQDITVQILSQLLAKDKRREDSQMLSDLLSEMLRRGSTTLAGYARRYTARWQEAVASAEEEIERVAKKVYKDKPRPEAEDPEGNEPDQNYAARLKNWIGEQVDQRINDVLSVMNLASKEQVSQLAGEMVSIGDRLATIEKLLKKSPEKIEEKDEQNQMD